VNNNVQPIFIQLKEEEKLHGFFHQDSATADMAHVKFQSSVRCFQWQDN
jgi:hypothetical protein